MKNIILILFYILLFPFSLSANDKEYSFSNISLKDGLSQITVNCIWQDKQGFMWFGTRSGLNKFNGYEFEVFTGVQGNPDTLTDNYITCITEDNDGNLWIATSSGVTRFNRATYSCNQFFMEENNPWSLSHNSVSTVYYDETDNIVWIGTNIGLCRYDCTTHQLERVNLSGLGKCSITSIVRKGDLLYLASNKYGLLTYHLIDKTCISYSTHSNPGWNIKDDNIREIYIDSKDNLWIGTRHAGIGLLRKGETRFIFIDQEKGLTNNFVRTINEAPDGNILAGTFNGLNVIDPHDLSISRYNNYDSNQGSLSHYSVLSIFFDKSNNLWVGTYGGGIDFSSPYESRFRFFDLNKEHSTVLGTMGTMVEYDNYLYIATEGGGLLEYDKTTGYSKQYNISNTRQWTYGRNILKTLYPDGQEILCGTNMGTIYSFNIRTKKFSLLYDLKEEKTVYHISRSSRGDLIVGSVSQKGLCFINKEGNMQNTFLVKGHDGDYAFPNIRTVVEIEEDVFLIGTRMHGVFKYSMKDNTLMQFRKITDEDIDTGLPENYITCILLDSSNRVWVGTFGEGICLLDPRTGKCEVINIQDGLHNNNVCNIVEDNNGHLWISTINGISDFYPEDRTFNNYSYANGIKIKEFTLHAGIRLSDDRIGFSGNNGFTLFRPSDMQLNKFIPPVVLEDLYINNEKVEPLSDTEPILTTRLNEQKSIVLKHNQTNISIEYSALNYAFPHNNRYAYMLKGFDHSWNYVGNRRMAYYTNIPPGKYLFVVKGSNNDGIWNEQGTSLFIQILPPFWKTGWAYCSYLLFVTLSLWLIFRHLNEKRRLKNDVRIKQMEAKAQKEFYEARNRLFTNFSHELRTPLTLVLSPLEDIIAKEEYLNLTQKKTFLLMRENTHRLLRLVNNLMSFQKKESGTMELRVSNSDFVEFSHEMFLAFKELSLSRNIEFNFFAADETMPAFFDKSLMEKVYFNFLSNAFKNVENGGSIEVSLNKFTYEELKAKIPDKIDHFPDSNISYLYTEIRDSGIGILQENLEKIFIPFFQVAQNAHAASGTGLGLSLSKSIIEMHAGIVWAESTYEQGATFTFILPVKKENFRASEIIEEEEIEFPVVEVEKERKELGNLTEEAKESRYTLLIVEDNRDVRNYLVSYFTDEYNILIASNGEEGIDKTLKHFPDLIITDLMMPKMNGIEMCNKLKNNQVTSHIPLIMLTARAVISDILEGYESGADDYITKPFHPFVLLARVKNILSSRERLKEIYGKRFTLESIGVEVTSIDEVFMQKLYKVLEDNIANSELNVDILSGEVGMSKSNLYRKVKSITNFSPNELVRNYRLEMAAKLLKDTEKTISEVYVEVGFNSLPYFSNCFKRQYGMTPTEYMAKKGE